MRRPALLLMDEPAAGLINSEVDEIDTLLRLLSKEMNIAIVIVEHRIELLSTIADRVMVMDAGEVISEGLIEDVLADPKVHAAYFEPDMPRLNRNPPEAPTEWESNRDGRVHIDEPEAPGDRGAAHLEIVSRWTDARDS